MCNQNDKYAVRMAQKMGWQARQIEMKDKQSSQQQKVIYNNGKVFSTLNIRIDINSIQEQNKKLSFLINILCMGAHLFLSVHKLIQTRKKND